MVAFLNSPYWQYFWFVYESTENYKKSVDVEYNLKIVFNGSSSININNKME